MNELTENNEQPVSEAAMNGANDRNEQQTKTPKTYSTNDVNGKQTKTANEDLSKDVNDLMKVANSLFTEENIRKLTGQLGQNGNLPVNTDILQSLNRLNGLGGLNGPESFNTLSGLNVLGNVIKQFSGSNKKMDEMTGALQEIKEKLAHLENKDAQAVNQDITPVLDQINGRLRNLEISMKMNKPARENLSDLQFDLESIKDELAEMQNILHKAVKKKKK